MIEEKLQALRNRYTFGGETPVYFLLHRLDYFDLNKKYVDIDQFMGIRIEVSGLAEQGRPLAVVEYKRRV